MEALLLLIFIKREFIFQKRGQQLISPIPKYIIVKEKMWTWWARASVVSPLSSGRKCGYDRIWHTPESIWGNWTSRIIFCVKRITPQTFGIKNLVSVAKKMPFWVSCCLTNRILGSSKELYSLTLVTVQIAAGSQCQDIWGLLPVYSGEASAFFCAEWGKLCLCSDQEIQNASVKVTGCSLISTHPTPHKGYCITKGSSNSVGCAA